MKLKFITLFSSFAIVSILLAQAYLVFSYDKLVKHLETIEVRTAMDNTLEMEENREKVQHLPSSGNTSHRKVDPTLQSTISTWQLASRGIARVYCTTPWAVGLLVTTLLLSLFCICTFWILYRSLSRQKELTVLKDVFFEHIAHELKRPVNCLVMAINSLSVKSPDSNPAFKQRCLLISKTAVNEISEKIKIILTLSMAEEGVFQLVSTPFDLKRVIEEWIIRFTFNPDKSLSIEFHTQQDKCLVRGDQEHLTQSIANLIDNAIKYSNDSVQIRIVLEKKEDNIRISVSDNGLGIAPERLKTIFDKYSRAHADLHHVAGTGIGLSYVKTVASQHRGTIEVVSEIDRGSTFTLPLPID